MFQGGSNEKRRAISGYRLETNQLVLSFVLKLLEWLKRFCESQRAKLYTRIGSLDVNYTRERSLFKCYTNTLYYLPRYLHLVLLHQEPYCLYPRVLPDFARWIHHPVDAYHFLDNAGRKQHFFINPRTRELERVGRRNNGALTKIRQSSF